MTNLEPNAGNWEMAIWETRGGCSERRGAPPTHILVNKPILQHFDILAFHQPPKRAVVGFLGHHGWPFYTEDTFYWLFIYCKQNALLKFVDIKTIPKDKNRVCLTVIDTSIQAPGVDSIAVSEFVNIG